MSFTKIEQSDLTGKGVIGLPDSPNLSTTDMQSKLDEIALDVIVPKFNELSDELDDASIDDAVLSDDITNLRLNSDQGIEISEDNGQTWHSTSSSGHKIMNGSGTTYPQEPRMQFSNNVVIQDDAVNRLTFIQIPPGEKGDKGDAATIQVGTVEGGDEASIENVGSQTDAIFDFVLPKGDPGNAATIQVGQVVSGQTASVTNSGTSSAAVFNFVLPKGEQGDPGTGLNLKGSYATLSDLETAHPTGSRGDAYFVEDDECVYLWDVDSAEWTNIGELKGPKGDTGAMPSISIGTVTTGQTSSVTITGTAEYPALNFVLEKGDKGDTGSSGTISVGSTSTLPAGSSATVTNSGTSTNAVFDFGIPTGPQGPQGNPTTVNGKSGVNVTLYGADLDMSSVDSTKVSTAIGNLQTSVSGVQGDIEDMQTATTLAVDLLNWNQDTTSQSGTTLYKKAISLTSVYVESPSVDIGAGTGYVLPTSAEQESYNLLQYVTVDDTVPCLYLYASEIPTTAFYIKVTGVE